MASEQAEPATLEDLVARHSRFLYRLVYACLRHPQDAEDVVQETFLKLHRNGAWRAAREPRALLATTAWRLALDRRRRRRTEPLEADSASAAPGPEREAAQRELYRRVERIVDALPEELRLPLALSAIEELCSAETARLLGVPEGTVRNRIHRARQMLREKLGAPAQGGMR
jgi:RNA polymerase sigma-70 factor (ECF subfamily)